MNGIRIGIIGLITDNTPNMIIPTGNENLTFNSPEALLRAQVKKTDPPVKINNTYVVQAIHYGADVGYLNIELDTTTHRMTQFSGKLITASDLPEPDPSVRRRIG